MFDQPRLLSRPMGVEWAGWRTDTFTLQQNGWEIATDFDIRSMTYRLLLRHKILRLYALTAAEHFDQLAHEPHFNAANLPVFRVVAVGPSFQTTVVPAVDFTRFREIDAEPRIVTTRIQRIEDMNIFAAPMPGSKGEVLVDGADMSVVEHLEAIKRLQAPKQSEIRDRILRTRDEGNEIDPGALKARSNIVALVHYEREAA